MEVHSHLHSSSKRWTHYLWEFLMLFLAVFSGFLAENFREHIVENNREKKLMQSLYADLKLDQNKLQISAPKFTYTFKWLDSTINLLNISDLRGREPLLAEAVFKATYWPYITFTDVTLNQLRSAGYFRLIKNDSLASEIASYDTRLKRSGETQSITVEHSRLIDEEAARFFDHKLIGNVFQKQMSANSSDSLDINQFRGIKLMTYDATVLSAYQLNFKKVWIAYKIMEEDYKRNFVLISDLIGKLKKEYHLE